MVHEEAVRAHKMKRILDMIHLLSPGSGEDRSARAANALRVRDSSRLQLVEGALVLVGSLTIVWDLVVELQIEFPFTRGRDDFEGVLVVLDKIDEHVTMHGPVAISHTCVDEEIDNRIILKRLAEEGRLSSPGSLGAAVGEPVLPEVLHFFNRLLHCVLSRRRYFFYG